MQLTNHRPLFAGFTSARQIKSTIAFGVNLLWTTTSIKSVSELKGDKVIMTD